MIAAFLVAVLALAAAVRGVRISGVLNPQIKSGVDRLGLIDCGRRQWPGRIALDTKSQRQNRSTFSDTATSSTTPGGSCGTRALMMW